MNQEENEVNVVLEKFREKNVNIGLGVVGIESWNMIKIESYCFQ